MSEKYLVVSWVAFVQQLQHLIARGYEEYCVVSYPEKKEDKFEKIDRKLISKYNANLDKDKSYYRKKKKICNFKFLRFGNQAIILKTKGKIEEGVVVDDTFKHVKKEKMVIPIGDKASLSIGYDNEKKVSVFMTKEMYREVKYTCFEYIDAKKFVKAIEAFNRLNALPSWGGIVEQKINMKQQIERHLQKALSKESALELAKKMKVNTKRTAIKVFV
ncbi:hypothetical protein [Bacillus cereus]|uniref:hypothetical protein n=1 Tax=Bacillus cereus TaxID=1396 RepID=UPI001F177F7A|nr:hypothetical protein [Bacillus cereus]BCC56686.1 hypothetical protein BCJMU07_p88 [Bacillus cereus]GMB79194.1 hypothetical protein BCER1_55960 [Bacillus cereus]GMB79202.1 hypothetical protein BCER1_56040 [Bacillus cereus]